MPLDSANHARDIRDERGNDENSMNIRIVDTRS